MLRRRDAATRLDNHQPISSLPTRDADPVYARRSNCHRASTLHRFQRRFRDSLFSTRADSQKQTQIPHTRQFMIIMGARILPIDYQGHYLESCWRGWRGYWLRQWTIGAPNAAAEEGLGCRCHDFASEVDYGVNWAVKEMKARWYRETIGSFNTLSGRLCHPIARRRQFKKNKSKNFRIASPPNQQLCKNQNGAYQWCERRGACRCVRSHFTEQPRCHASATERAERGYRQVDIGRRC